MRASTIVVLCAATLPVLSVPMKYVQSDAQSHPVILTRFTATSMDGTTVSLIVVALLQSAWVSHVQWGNRPGTTISERHSMLLLSCRV